MRSRPVRLLRRAGRILVASTSVLLALSWSPARLQADTACEDEPNPNSDGIAFAPCELLVKFKAGVDGAPFIFSFGTEVIENFKTQLTDGPLIDVSLDPGDVPPDLLEGADIYWLRIVEPDRTVAETVDDFQATGQVLFATPNMLLDLLGHQPVPDDALYSRQWNLLNVGQTGGTIDADIDAPQGWELHHAIFGPGDVDCTTVIVAVMDTGVDFAHDDLSGNKWIGPFGINGVNFRPAQPAFDVSDHHGHGTFVAGIIGALGDNETDISGICWRARIMALKVLETGGDQAFLAASTRATLSAVGYNVFASLFGLPPIRVLNISFGGDARLGQPPHPGAALAVAVALANAADILVVAGAGNFNRNLDAPARANVAYVPCQSGKVLLSLEAPLNTLSVPSLMCVASSNDIDNLRNTDYGSPSVDLAAPGELVHGLSGQYDRLMNFYRDEDGDLLVGEDDVRLRQVTTTGIAYPTGAVAAGDADEGSRLVTIPPDVKHDETVSMDNPAKYDAGECVYRDRDNDGKVSPGDHRYLVTTACPAAPTGFVVAVDDGDINEPLVGFAADELKTSTRWGSGTSFAAPHVAGVAALCLSTPGFASVSSATMRGLIRRFVDKKTRVRLGADGTLASNTQGRLRWPCTADLGDLRQAAGLHDACGYHTVQSEPFMRLGLTTPPAVCDGDPRGPVHRDTGLEWLGGDVSNEHNADAPPPRDEDTTANILPLANRDRFDDGFIGFAFDANMNIVDIEVSVCTTTSGMSDFDGGRYRNADADSNLYLNGYFDWNNDGDFDLPGEHNVSHRLDDFPVPGTTQNTVPPPKDCFIQSFPLFRAAPRAGLPGGWRLRLDYGENVGRLVPSQYSAPDPRRLDHHRDIALFGEVEDYPFGDAYLCYGAADKTRPRPDLPAVDLTDQFHAATYDVGKPRRFCTPANKNNEGVLDEVTHLKAYRIALAAGEHLQPTVQATNQFGFFRLHVVREDSLIVPSAKGLTAPPSPPDSTLPGFEHYKCYRVTEVGRKRRPTITVDVKDQFGTGKYAIRRPKRFCNPVAKTPTGGVLEPIRNPLRHLVCYGLRPIESIDAPDEVHSRNQFGTERLKLKREKELCVPSLKLVIKPTPLPTPEPSPSPTP